MNNLQKFYFLYIIIIDNFCAKQHENNNYYKNYIIEKALEAMHIYELLLKAGNSTSFDKILQLPNRSLWIKTYKNKIQNFINHDTFELVKCPDDTDILVISRKWVFRYKQELKNQILK